MKTKFLLAFFTLLAFSLTNVKAAETEPNNTKAQASVLTLNGSNTGKIGTSTDVDWYKVTTNSDGRIDLTLTVSNNLYCYFAIYDNDGVTLLHQDYTSTSYIYSVDGLATGTYYVKIFPYYTAQLPEYTIADALVKPTQANDAEPDSTRAQALTMALGGSVTGHIGYLYNNHRDSADMYKVTTNADGLLSITLNVANNQYVYFNIYDNDAKTLLHQDYTSTSYTYSVDGLAAGTYYIKVFTYYNTGFAPYTLSNQLTKPTEANDVEPDSTKAQAIALTPNTKKTGHIGYFYNNHRDSVDWYKITTSADGNINLNLKVANNQYVYFDLYDNDAKTLLHSDYTSTTYGYNVDGLAKGTYYLKVYNYYTNGFAPYTIADTLTTYNATDVEPNKYAKNAKTINANVNSNGHIGFYYDVARDSVDWYKINYTGAANGSMTLNFKLLPHVSDASTNYTWIQVYKDTTATPVYSNYFSGTQVNAITLNTLAQGYYYVKIYPYYNGQFEAFTLQPVFTQKKIATVSIVSYTTSATCDSSNQITFKPGNSNGTTKVQLFRFDSLYATKTVAKNANAIFNNLPTGNYYAKVFADGATGNAFAKSDVIALEAIPVSLKTQSITNTSAKFSWTKVTCAGYYVVEYRKHGAAVWTVKQTKGNVNSLSATGLTANTNYEWKVASADSANGITSTGLFADSIRFTTTNTTLIAQNSNDGSENLITKSNSIGNVNILVTPNPAASYFVIRYKGDFANKANATLYDMKGIAVWTSGLINADALNNKTVNASQFSNGVFYLKITDEQGKIIGITKIIVAK